jgi:hypothetical protein
MYGAGVPQAPPVQGDVGRQLRVFWTGAEGQAVSGLATVVQEAAGMANVRFTQGGEDRWYTLRKDSMTIAEDGSNFEWADRAHAAHAAHVAARPPHPKSTRNRPYLDAPLLAGVAAAAAAARKGRPAIHKGGYVVSGGAAAQYLARHMALQGAGSVAATAANAVANANSAIDAASVVGAQACGEGGDNGGGSGRGGGDDGAFNESDNSDDSDSGGERGTEEMGAPVCWKRLLGSASARHSPAQPGPSDGSAWF